MQDYYYPVNDRVLQKLLKQGSGGQESVYRIFEKFLRDLLIDDPNDVRTMLRLGVLYRETGRIGKSLRYLLRCRKSEQTEFSSQIHFELANTYKELGDFQLALEELLQIQENDFTEGMRELADFCGEMP